MFAFQRVRGMMVAAILALAAGFAGGVPARANDYGAYCAPTCHYSIITVYVPKTVAYTKLVTYYDHCGRPYQVAKTCYRTIQVPVQKRVLVCD
jgi:hypothetical protein